MTAGAASVKASTAPAAPALYVDLDGTLTYSDLLMESFLELLKKNILYLFLVPIWLLRGKANLKYQISERVRIRPELLPYNNELLDYLREQRASGRRLVLVSASSESLVEQVSRHLGIFDSALGSSRFSNCSGSHKLQCIRADNTGNDFVYAGNARVDLKVWCEAKAAIVVNASAAIKRQAAAVAPLDACFEGRYRSPAGVFNRIIKAMRLHQWTKNALLFLPLLLAHQVASIPLLLQVVTAFFCFGLCASSVYILNDMLDLPSDRQHHSKQRRPFAAGDLSLQYGLIMSPVLLAASFALALRLPLEFIVILGVYYFSTCLYSFVLKKIELVDVITLATLYTLRIIAGAAAVSVIPTFWLLAFSMFLFVSLAIIKRYTELSVKRESGINHSEGRGYTSRDLEMLAVFGTTSGLMSVMVFALYINSDDILQQYASPEILWFICPLLLYLVARIWLLAFRGEIEEDPVVFALTDGISQTVTLLSIALLWMASIDWNFY